MCSLRENIHEIVTVHSVHSNVAKIHSRLPAAMRILHIQKQRINSNMRSKKIKKM